MTFAAQPELEETIGRKALTRFQMVNVGNLLWLSKRNVRWRQETARIRVVAGLPFLGRGNSRLARLGQGRSITEPVM